jgi:hypothetical protein
VRLSLASHYGCVRLYVLLFVADACGFAIVTIGVSVHCLENVEIIFSAMFLDE